MIRTHALIKGVRDESIKCGLVSRSSRKPSSASARPSQRLLWSDKFFLLTLAGARTVVLDMSKQVIKSKPSLGRGCALFLFDCNALRG